MRISPSTTQTTDRHEVIIDAETENRDTAVFTVRDNLSSKQQYPSYQQDPHSHAKKPKDMPRMSLGYHSPHPERTYRPEGTWGKRQKKVDTDSRRPSTAPLEGEIKQNHKSTSSVSINVLPYGNHTALVENSKI